MAKRESLVPTSEMARKHAEWMAAVDDITVRHMVEWLKAGVELRKPIDSLSKAALSALAEIARATYIVELSKRRREREALPPEEQDQLEMWLI